MQYFVYLSSFLAVYRVGSFRKAASVLHMSQPAISNHIQSLENRLNQKLFKKSSRGVTPTDFAHHLASVVTTPIDQLDKIITLEDKKNTLSITMDYDLVSQIPKSFYHQMSECRIFINNESEERVKKIELGEFDFAITRNIHFVKNVEKKKLFSEKHILVGAPVWEKKLIKNKTGKLDANSLQNVDWVISHEAFYFVEEYYRVAFSEEFQAAPKITINSLAGVLDLVLKDAGVSILPERMCQPYLDAKELMQLHFPEEYPFYTVYLISQKGRQKEKSFAKMHTLLFEYLSKAFV